MIEQILNTSQTKTSKIKALLELGLTRKQVAETMGVGYGFVQNVFAATYPDRVNSNRFEIIEFNKKFGVEIEAYNVNKNTLAEKLRGKGVSVEIEGYNHSTRRHWKIVSDSSLQGRDSFEIVSPVLQGQAGLDELKKVCEALKECNAYINKSCGLHIHFDATQMKISQWKNLILNYQKLEPVIDSFMPASRRGNNNTFCKSLGNISELASKVKRATTVRSLQQIVSSRYFKLNLQSFTRHNTVEFRHHSGTIEFEKIHNWVTFLHNLVEYSKKAEVKDSNFESLSKFNKPETMNFLRNRIERLAA